MAKRNKRWGEDLKLSYANWLAAKGFWVPVGYQLDPFALSSQKDSTTCAMTLLISIHFSHFHNIHVESNRPNGTHVYFPAVAPPLALAIFGEVMPDPTNAARLAAAVFWRNLLRSSVLLAVLIPSSDSVVAWREPSRTVAEDGTLAPTFDDNEGGCLYHIQTLNKLLVIKEYSITFMKVFKRRLLLPDFRWVIRVLEIKKRQADKLTSQFNCSIFYSKCCSFLEALLNNALALITHI